MCDVHGVENVGCSFSQQDRGVSDKNVSEAGVVTSNCGIKRSWLELPATQCFVFVIQCVKYPLFKNHRKATTCLCEIQANSDL